MKDEIRKFLRNALVFIVIVLVALSIMSYLYFNVVLPKKVTQRTDKVYTEYLKNRNIGEIELAFFGESHTRDDIDPCLIPDSYNFGGSAQSYIETFYRLKRATEKDKIKIKNILIEIDLQSFSNAQHRGGREFKDLTIYSKYVPKEELKEVAGISSKELFIKTKVPFIGNGEEFAYLTKNPTTEIFRGWTKREGNFETKNKEKLSVNTYQNQFLGFERINNKSMEFFQKTLELARENNISVILVKYPSTNYYSQFIDEKKVDKKDYYEKIFRETEKIMGKNYFVMDYYSIYFNHPEFFYNADHLNYLGAEDLSKKIYEDLKTKGIVKEADLKTEIVLQNGEDPETCLLKK